MKQKKEACRICGGRKDLRYEGWQLKGDGQSVRLCVCYACRRERYLKYSKPASGKRSAAYGPRKSKTTK